MLFSFVALALLLAADYSPVQAKNHILSRLPRHHDLSERMLVHSTNNTEIKPRSGRECRPKYTTTPTKPVATTTKVATNAATTTAKATSRGDAKAATATTDPEVSGDILGVAFKATTTKTATRPGTTTKVATNAATITAKATSRGNAKATTTPTRPTKVITKSTPVPTRGSSSGNILGVALKPSDWPTATQAGPAPAETRASASDPFLLELSKAYNNKNNLLYTKTYTGDMTFYAQGTGACGDTYDDSSFTAAVSHTLYDSWPGATQETTRNPICGPYVPGRKSLSSSGSFVTSVPGSSFMYVGGDGLPNCDPMAKAQCHIPLTATVMHGDNKIIVSIVDRCQACKEGDIDLTPTAFKALADPKLGRTSVTWWFNEF